ncbi:hypothetical protein K493DRAFT_308819 [Basidiobolus meristosporus CBS 931.73]|uniref:P-type ATPase A domain-containing protein n=1 Tax=Basidiobolus meristosporus CBS 931.73 TaxID=1314790 RepID=A0A1Y1WWA3_9FUNG|nr:hypothetical protein K493DRAFT_308819 [Basidiobolus meristosporus CBS 931.73]|eukprot:ORX77839.1 hypothetical protein K493DRAFT_308819 [Basidiobolus meristosporus CBS 931.73]
MDVPVSLGTGVAYFALVGTCIADIVEKSCSERHQFFGTIIYLITLILLGKFLEAYTIKEEINFALVQQEDILKVNPGIRIPCDSTLYHGTSTFDESTITGESIPIWKSAENGDRHRISATVIALKIGIKPERVTARVVPEEKASKVASLNSRCLDRPGSYIQRALLHMASQWHARSKKRSGSNGGRCNQLARLTSVFHLPPEFSCYRSSIYHSKHAQVYHFRRKYYAESVTISRGPFSTISWPYQCSILSGYIHSLRNLQDWLWCFHR